MEKIKWQYEWKLPQLNLGTLVSILIAVGFITFQGIRISNQISGNSDSIAGMTHAVEELAGAAAVGVQGGGGVPPTRRADDRLAYGGNVFRRALCCQV